MVGDLLSITVFDIPALAQHLRVSGDGTISVALIGEVKVAGLTQTQAGVAIEQAYLDAGIGTKVHMVNLYLEKRSVTDVSLEGEVVVPGVYPLNHKQSVDILLSQAGGPTARAGKTWILHRASLGGKYACVEFDQQSAESITILPGDRLRLRRAIIVYVFGEVRRPGGYDLMGLPMTAGEAMALAGTPQNDYLTWIRSTPAGQLKTEIAIDPSKIESFFATTLEDGDFIYASKKKPLIGTAWMALQGVSSASVYHLREPR
jgi:polysaccharide export outer membrane protein